MKLSKINDWLALVGNIGVILGIIFLATEIQQNTLATQAQTRSNISQNYINVSEWFMDAELAKLVIRSNLGEQLSSADGEITQLYSLYQGMFSTYEHDWYQYQAGLYKEQDFSPQLARWENVMRNQPAARSTWNSSRQYFEATFRERMDMIVDRVEENL